MDHKQLQTMLDFTVNESFRSDVKIPLWIWGDKGVGKTTAVKEFCKKNNIECICLHTASQDPGDLIGIPFTLEYVTKWGRPEWFPQEDGKKYVIFLDELNRANQDVLQCMLPFALEGKLHVHQLPKNCVVIAAGNPNNDNYTVTSVEDKALLSRFGHIVLNANQKEWTEHVQKEKFDHAFMNCIIKAGYVGFKTLTLSEFMEVEPDPRSLALVLNKLTKMTKDQMEVIGQDFVAMFTGTTYGNLFRKEKENDLTVFDGEKILKDYNAIRKEICKNLNGVERRNDLMTTAFDIIINTIKNRPADLKPKELDNLTQFLLDTGSAGLQTFMELTDKDKKCQHVIKHMSVSKLTNLKGDTATVMLSTTILDK